MDFYAHLHAGKPQKAKGLLFTPIRDQTSLKHLDEFLEIIRKQSKPGGVHAFDAHVLQNLAVVVLGIEDSEDTDNLDTEPLFLRKKDDKWRLLFTNSATQLKLNELTSAEMKARVDRLFEWYEKREESVRREWRKRKPSDSVKK